MGMGVENRWDRRLPVNVPVEIRHPLLGKRRARLRDVSGGGVFIATDVPLDQGTVVELSVPLPGGVWAGAMRFHALVIWVGSNGAGLMFCQDDDIAYRLLEGHARAGSPPASLLVQPVQTPTGAEL